MTPGRNSQTKSRVRRRNPLQVPLAEEPPSEKDAARHLRYREASPPAKKPGGKERFLRLLGNVVPKKGDPPLEIVRKCVFLWRF